MAKSKGKHVSDKAQYVAYAALLKRIKNRKIKLARHLKLHPNDTQATAAAKTDGTQKSTPMTKGHFPPEKDVTLRTPNGTVVIFGSYEPLKKETKNV